MPRHKVRIEQHTEMGMDCPLESTKVFVDNEYVGDGFYGGEPEDNTRDREYSWVQSLLCQLSTKLGAEVEVVHITTDEDEE
jgi:hypothetical protein